jgi:glycolate oxidase
MESMTAHAQLIADLERVVGADSVFHSPSDLLVYEYDGSVEGAVDLARPVAVTLPRTAREVAEIVKIGKRAGLPIIPRGAGTGLSGGAVAQSGGIIVALTRMDQILSVDYDNEIAMVEPGVINLELSDFTGQRGYFFAPDPSSQRACTIGGNVAENSGGPHCLKYGVTTNHVLGLEFVTSEGDVKWVESGQTGYDLTAAMVGSEGMLGIVTRARVKITPAPEQISVILAAFPDIETASQAVTAVISAGIVPAALEMMDALTIQAVEPAFHAGYPMDAGAVLLIEIDGRPEDVDETQAEIESICRQAQAMQVRSATSKVERDLLWKGRKMAIAAMGRLAPNYYLHDTVVPRTRLPETMKRVYEIADDFSLPIANMFHAGDGNLHPLMLFDRHNKIEVERVLEASKHLITYCVEIGGALTGEHGIGTEKRSYMRMVFDENDLAAMAGVKQTFDPAALFNPEKIFPSGYVCGEVRALRAQAIAQKHGIYPM